MRKVHVSQIKKGSLNNVFLFLESGNRTRHQPATPVVLRKAWKGRESHLRSKGLVFKTFGYSVAGMNDAALLPHRRFAETFLFGKTVHPEEQGNQQPFCTGGIAQHAGRRLVFLRLRQKLFQHLPRSAVSVFVCCAFVQQPRKFTQSLFQRILVTGFGQTAMREGVRL